MKIDWVEQGVLAASGIPLGKQDMLSLKEQGIGAVVTLTEQPLTIQKELTSEFLQGIPMNSLHVPIVDQQPPSIEQARDVATFIQEMQTQGEPVLIHCHAGVGRTGTMLHAYYLMRDLTLDEAQSEVKAGRPSAQYIMLTDLQKAFLADLGKRLEGSKRC